MIDHTLHKHLQKIEIPKHYKLVDPVFTSIVNGFDLEYKAVNFGSINSYLKNLEQQDHRIILFQHDEINNHIHHIHPTDIWFTCSSTTKQPVIPRDSQFYRAC